MRKIPSQGKAAMPHLEGRKKEKKNRKRKEKREPEHPSRVG